MASLILIHWIEIYPVDSAIQLMFEQPGPDFKVCVWVLWNQGMKLIENVFFKRFKRFKVPVLECMSVSLE